MSRHVGVDIGTSSIRVTYDSQTNELPIGTHRGKFISQSSVPIYKSLLQLLPSQYDSIAISATCSAVITRKRNGYLEPFNIESTETPSDILLWMDNSAIRETEFLNNLCTSEISQARRQLGGKFVAELGLPKLKMIQNLFGNEDLVCFELYDWISYLLKYEATDGKVAYHPFEHHESAEMYAIDGSIKGWSKKLLSEAGITLEIGGISLPSDVPRLGEPIGVVCGTNAVIGHGCIDCYAGWINSYSGTNANSCFMVAGTSTCFIYSSQQRGYHPGIWGPYRLAKDSQWLYEFGQPATGKLYERVFEKHGLSRNDYATTFKTLEEETRAKSQSGKGIHELLKGYFYYGDVYGNRTPYQDGNMSEMIVDNPNGPLGPIINTTTPESLLAEYNLIMEFIVFQTKELIEPLGIDTLIISGSQSKNTRFVQLLADVCNVSVKVISADCCLGAAKMGHIAQLCQQNWAYENAFDEVTKGNTSSKVVNPGESCGMKSPTSETELSLLYVKYEIYSDMANRQRQYRDMMGDIYS
ncbi:hypothetical protein CORT_0D07120 [Candida orthopsilosis Co 90-125]|uniref:Carbohydrate kinase FGGY C-terminal domain-containing protein n=1 Tax=Candida orthopsilosis (strain 90-125) TaxID=1136231 RepID=H8X5T7_CANO9|nr:hypothetical protein CORT_0D07120 [Candida orthopsilosis Co 90-125]CCG23545.1 hypothetical protein CORT_0D07120 [Candida orthopsilosis Co 90-125]